MDEQTRQYKISDNGTILSGTARDILGQILRKESEIVSDMDTMDVDKYTDALIRGADYHLPTDVANAFEGVAFPTKYDKALELLSILPASGTAILPGSARSGSTEVARLSGRPDRRAGAKKDAGASRIADKKA